MVPFSFVLQKSIPKINSLPSLTISLLSLVHLHQHEKAHLIQPFSISTQAFSFHSGCDVKLKVTYDIFQKFHILQ